MASIEDLGLLMTFPLLAFAWLVLRDKATRPRSQPRRARSSQ